MSLFGLTQTIDLIRRHHKSGKSQRKIADYLNKNGVKSKRGGAWTGCTVDKILSRI